jgi:glucose uptake protein
MIPNTYTLTLLALLLSIVCWGSWASTQKAVGKWRFELYYFDFAIGALLMSLVLALTFGTFSDNLTFEDNLTISGKRQMAMAFSAGAIFNLGNMLLVAASAIAGMSVAFPIALGLALVVTSVVGYFTTATANPSFLFIGIALLLGAVIADALAHRQHTIETAVTKKHGGGIKGILLSLFSGLLLSAFPPVLASSRAGDIGLGVYAAIVFFALGILLSSLLYSLYFMNLPVQGDALSLKEYVRGTIGQHGWGLVGGAIWCVGTVANLAAASAPKGVGIGSALCNILGQSAAVLAVTWGLLGWKEFAGASSGVKTLLAATLVLFCAGLALLTLA